MNIIEARQLAEMSFKPAAKPPKSIVGYVAEAIANREKSARLKIVRLAKQEHSAEIRSARNCGLRSKKCSSNWPQ